MNSSLSITKRKIKVEVILLIEADNEKAIKDGIRAGLNLIREGANGVGCGENGVYEYRIISKKEQDNHASQ